MKVLKKSKMPDGTDIQIEDWKDVYEFTKTNSIVAYPKAKNTSKYGYVRNNERFRLELIHFKDDEQVENIFNKLEKGTIKLEELSKHFYTGHQDMYYLGMVETEEIQEEQDEEL